MDVWLLPVAASDTRLLTVLSESERRRADGYYSSEARTHFVLARALTRIVLGRRLSAPPAAVIIGCSEPRGGMSRKPRIVAPDNSLDFSIAHSGDLVGVAVAPRSIGLDVEATRPVLDEAHVAEAILSPRELAIYIGTDPQLRQAALLCAWTRKEAVLKASGAGLRIPPQSLELLTPLAEAGRPSREPPSPVGDFTVEDLALDSDYFGAVATLGPLRGIALRDGAPVVTAWLSKQNSAR